MRTVIVTIILALVWFMNGCAADPNSPTKGVRHWKLYKGPGYKCADHGQNHYHPYGYGYRGKGRAK